VQLGKGGRPEDNFVLSLQAVPAEQRWPDRRVQTRTDEMDGLTVELGTPEVDT
jgi:hypothetical protein